MAYGRSSYYGGGVGQSGSGDEYDQAYQRAQAPAFNYTPNPNDPELQLLRSRFLRQGGERRGNLINEIARAGLLGSSAGMQAINGLETDIAGGLQDIDSGTFARRRSEALGLYSGDVDFRRQLQLERLRAILQKEIADQQSRDALIGGIGQLGGAALGAFL